MQLEINTKNEVFKLWGGFLDKLVDITLVVLSTHEVDAETVRNLETVVGAIDKTYSLLSKNYKKAKNFIFYESQYVVVHEIYKILERYDVKDNEKLGVLLSQLRIYTKHRKRLES